MLHTNFENPRRHGRSTMMEGFESLSPSEMSRIDGGGFWGGSPGNQATSPSRTLTVSKDETITISGGRTE